MITLSITEKAWDAVRPSSVKKTGLSESIRALAKLNKAHDTPKGFDDLAAAVKSVQDAVEDAMSVVAKNKADDKKGAAAKLAGWKTECAQAVNKAGYARDQVGLAAVSAQCATFLNSVDDAIQTQLVAGKTLLKDIEAGKLDSTQITIGVQRLYKALGDGTKYTQKDGFAGLAATRPALKLWNVNAADVPMPAIAKQIKANVDQLHTLAKSAGGALEGVVDNKDTSNDSKRGQALIAEFRGMRDNLKAGVAPAKKLNAQMQQLAEQIKQKLATGGDPSRMMPVVEKSGKGALEFYEDAVRELGRGRNKGELVRARKEVRAFLAGRPALATVEAAVEDEWRVCMAVFKEISEPMDGAFQQLQRMARLIGDASPEARPQATKFAADLDNAHNMINNKYT
jgi:hypothetical protein